jgi:tRNA dimethylallyltransferase
MLKSGMIAETEKVIEMGFSEKCEGLKSIGYKHVLEYLEGVIKREELLAFLQRDTRHYAKRQLTWFRKDKRVNWIQMDGSKMHPEKIAERILKSIDNLV